MRQEAYLEVAHESALEPVALTADDKLMNLPGSLLALNLDIGQPAALKQPMVYVSKAFGFDNA